MLALAPNYGYVTATKTLTLTDLASIDLGRVGVIVNVTRQTVAYSPTNSAYGTITASGTNGLVLSADPGGGAWANGDKFAVSYDFTAGELYAAAPVLDTNAMRHFKEEFAGAALDATLWTTTTVGAMTAAVAGSLLTLATGTANGDSITVRSTIGFCLPFRVIFQLTLSQRIANQSFVAQITNAAGDTVAAFVFDGTTATTNKVRTSNAGTTLADAAVTSQTTASMAVFALDLRAEGVDFYDLNADTAASMGIRATRTRLIPKPDEKYFIEISATNTGAAASNTNLQIESVYAEQVSPLLVDIAGGHGSSTTGRALPVIANSALLTSAGGRVGYVGAAGIWQDATSTPLTGAATFTGTGRDLVTVATNTAFNTITAYAKEYRVEAMADVAGTLYLEVSRDNVTFRRIKKVALAQTDGTSLFYGEIIHAPKTRYARAVFVNGAGAQTVFLLQELMLA